MRIPPPAAPLPAPVSRTTELLQQASPCWHESQFSLNFRGMNSLQLRLHSMEKWKSLYPSKRKSFAASTSEPAVQTLRPASRMVQFYKLKSLGSRG